jgi:hypothetical protein
VTLHVPGEVTVKRGFPPHGRGPFAGNIRYLSKASRWPNDDHGQRG